MSKLWAVAGFLFIAAGLVLYPWLLWLGCIILVLAMAMNDE